MRKEQQNANGRKQKRSEQGAAFAKAIFWPRRGRERRRYRSDQALRRDQVRAAKGEEIWKKDACDGSGSGRLAEQPP